MSDKAKDKMMKGQEKRGLVPRLRFPEFRGAGEWEESMLGEICEVLNNRRKPITSSDRVKGPYPYYGASGITDYVADFIFNERLLLIGEDGARWGAHEKTAFIVDGKYWVNNHAHVMKPFAANDILLENYLTLLDLSPFITGAAPPKLTLGKLKEVPIPVSPSDDEQQKIADCLSSIDELITAEAQYLDTLKTHKKGLMQQLFPKEGETVPRLRFPEFREAGGWEEKRLGDAGKFTGGGTPSKDNKAYWEGVNPWISSSDISEDSIHEIKISRFITDEAIQETATKLVPPDSILLVSRVGVGKLAITHKPICTSQDFTNFTPAKDNLIFMAYYLRSLKNIFLSFNQGMAIKGFTKEDVSNLEICVPQLKEQQKIADCLSSLDELITAEAQHLDTLKTHKKGLMQQLFPSDGDLR